MSLVTTCPACHTTFLIKPEQLTAHRGYVCCGQCAHVFDALEQLSEIPAAPVEPAPAPAAAPHPAAEPVEEPVEEPAEEPVAAAHGGSMALPPASAMLARALEEAPAEQAAAPGRSTPILAVRAPHAGDAFALPPPRRRLPRGSWLALGGLLALLAGMQTLYFRHDEIAARLPASAPLLTHACQLLGCRVELPRQAALLSIEDAALSEHEAHAGVYVLGCTLINHARFAQALPVLEVTLTDLNDSPVMRRTLAPAEYLPARQLAAARLPARSAIPVTVYFRADALQAAGYRIYVTYP